MGRDIIFRSPRHFFNRHTFALAVHRIAFLYLQTHHMRFIFRIARNITVHNGISGVIAPVVRSVVIAYHYRTHTFGVDISILILPAFLQKEVHFRKILTFYIGYLAETRCTNTLFPVGHFHLVVKLDCNGLFRKRNTGVQHFLRIFRSLDRLVHITEEYGTGSQHRNIHNAKYLYTFHTGVHTGAKAITPFFRKYRSIGFGNTRHACHYIGSSPGRAPHIRICLILCDSSSRPDSKYILGGATDNPRLFNLTINPLIHISKRNHFDFMLCRCCYATKHYGQQTQHTKFFTNHFFSLLQSIKVHSSIVSVQNPSFPEPAAPYGHHIYIYSSYNLSYRLHTVQ